MNQNMPLADPDRLIKKLGQEAVNNLSRKTVGIIGLGSLGSKTAVMLAENLIGGYVLIDADILSEENIVRHAADRRYFRTNSEGKLEGWPKVYAVEDLIQNRYHKARIVTIQDYAQNAFHMLNGVDIVIVAGLGSEIVQQEIGEKLYQLGFPTLFGGVYEKGVGGEVLLVEPTGPCYACFSSHLRNEVDTTTSQKVDYGMPLDEVKAEPGLGMHVSRVAVVLADWALRYLINDSSVLPPFKGNLAILSNDEMELGQNRGGEIVYLSPSSSQWRMIKKRPKCLVCGLSNELHSTESISDLLE